MSRSIWEAWGDGLFDAGRAIIEAGLFLNPLRVETVIFEHWSATIERLLDVGARAGWRAMTRDEKVMRLEKGMLSYQSFADTVIEGIARHHPGIAVN